MKILRLPEIDIKRVREFWLECGRPDMIVVGPEAFTYFYSKATTRERNGHPRARKEGIMSIRLWGVMLLDRARGRIQCAENQIWLIDTGSEAHEDNGLVIIGLSDNG